MGMRKYPFVTIFLALFFFLLLAKPHYFDMSLNRFVSVDTTKLQTIASKKIATLKGSPLVVSGANYEYVSTGFFSFSFSFSILFVSKNKLTNPTQTLSLSRTVTKFLCSVREASPETQKHLLFFPLDLKTNSFLSTKFPKVLIFLLFLWKDRERREGRRRDERKRKWDFTKRWLRRVKLLFNFECFCWDFPSLLMKILDRSTPFHHRGTGTSLKNLFVISQAQQGPTIFFWWKK